MNDFASRGHSERDEKTAGGFRHERILTVERHLRKLFLLGGGLQVSQALPKLLVLFLSVIPLFGCEDKCKENPGDEECLEDLPPLDDGVDGQAPAGDATVCGNVVSSERLFYKSVELDDGELVQTGYCGFYRRELVFQMPEGAPKRGFVVQRVVTSREGHTLNPAAFTQDLEEKPNVCYDPGLEEDAEIVWELFGPIEKCEKSPYALKCGAYSEDGNGNLIPPRGAGGEPVYQRDLNLIAQFPTSEGVVVHDFQASYYTEEEMGTYWPTGMDGAAYWQPYPPFNICGHIDGNGPPFWNNIPKPRLERRIKVSWECCPAQETVVQDDTHVR